MKICVIGTGYVGLVAGACLAEMGNEVTCIDNDRGKLEQLRCGRVPIYEPGLEELIRTNAAEGRLRFSGDLAAAVRGSLVCFIAVGTPQDEDGSADLQQVEQVAGEIGRALNGYKVIVDKSTVPVGTAARVHEIINGCCSAQWRDDFDVVSNPEFLKQGNAVDDFLRPDRVVIGSDSRRATEIMQEIYEPFLRTGNPVIVMDVRSAEMTKYAANSFLAVKISYANEIANICERVGADAELVRVGMCSDRRIGSQFMFPGLGYGGSCFPKDVRALISTAQRCGYESRLLRAADEVNLRQRQLFIDRILQRFGSDLAGLTFAVWGLAFKPKTNDMRMAPSITVIEALLSHGARVQAYDPKACDTARALFGERITYADNAYAALTGADALLLLTEWHEFRRPDFGRIRTLLRQAVIFDGRNQYDDCKLEALGFEYVRIGRARPPVPPAS